MSMAKAASRALRPVVANQAVDRLQIRTPLIFAQMSLDVLKTLLTGTDIVIAMRQFADTVWNTSVAV